MTAFRIYVTQLYIPHCLYLTVYSDQNIRPSMHSKKSNFFKITMTTYENDNLISSTLISAKYKEYTRRREKKK